MKDEELNILINSLKAQVNVLEAKIKDIQKVAKPEKFADFYGVFAELGETSEDEIKAVEFKCIREENENGLEKSYCKHTRCATG